MEKAKEIARYLASTQWSPVEFLLQKFNADRTDVADAVEELLNKMVDVRVESDIVHAG